jgi:UDP-hydrolysing UDP-N-acetyl-D-glucosamine 2-epimerase
VLSYIDYMEKKKRKICFVITSKIHYARSRFIMDELQKSEDVDLQLIVGGSALLRKYGNVLEHMEEDGFSPQSYITMNIEGGNPVAMAKTTGLGVIEFTTAYDNLKPDLVVIRGDRFEVLSAVIAAAYMNIPIAHIEGGEITGTIDESVRHAISKFAHIHFATTSQAADRLRRMGEDPKYIFTVGSPDVEFVARAEDSPDVTNELINEKRGTGAYVDITKPYIMVMQHPVTTECDQGYEQVEKTLNAIHELEVPAIWFWPNVDAGTDGVSKGIRVFREFVDPKHVRFITHFPPTQFTTLLRHSKCLVGNSSAGIKECSYLGIPAVNIGTRQSGRLRAENVMDTPHDKEEIKKAVTSQLEHGLYPQSQLYYKENTSKNIVDTLTSIDLYIQKKFHE